MLKETHEKLFEMDERQVKIYNLTLKTHPKRKKKWPGVKIPLLSKRLLKKNEKTICIYRKL